MQREIAVIPHFGQVEGIDFVVSGLLFGHQLHLHQPAGIIAPFDRFEQVALVRLPVFGDDRLGFGVREVLDALQGAQMELHPDTFVLIVDKTVRMATETMHMSIRVRNAARTHRNRYLMQGLGKQSPEIPVVILAS